MNSSTSLVVHRDHFDYEMLMVVAGFLAGYTGNTLMAYQHDLRVFASWCQTRELPLLEVRRAHIELFTRSQETAVWREQRSHGGCRRWPASTATAWRRS